MSNLTHEQLTGSDLLAAVKENPNLPKSDLVRSCGYVSSKKDGGERLNFTAFYEALLQAKGVSIGDSVKANEGRRGKRLSYVARTHFNGNLMIGRAYMELLGAEPGDEFEIKLSKSGIRLIPLNSQEETEEELEEEETLKVSFPSFSRS